MSDRNTILVVGDPPALFGPAFDAGATDYLAARGTDEEAAWLAHRVRAAIEAHRSDRGRTRRYYYSRDEG